jgi:predicted CoA-binding protein
MVSQKTIADFLSQKKIAIIGVSRDSKQFANTAYRLLKTQGYVVYPVNPFTERVENDRCYPAIKSLPELVDGVLMMLPPEKTLQVLPEVAEAGIQHVWLQQQTDSPQAVQFCVDHNINVVYGECIMMFVEPLSFPHQLHRWGKKVFGSLPK